MDQFLFRVKNKKSPVFKNALDQNVKRINKLNKTGADYYEIGTFYLREKKFQDAIKWFSDGISVFPSFLKSYEGITYSYILNNKTPEAEKWLLAGLGKNEKSAYLYSILGLINIIDTNYVESLKWSKRGISYDNKSLENFM